MHQLHDRVARAMRALAPQGGRVVAAVSGGPDSVAMTHLLRAIAPQSAIELAGIAHFNHRLRGAESDGDEAFCRALASQIGVPLVADSADVARYAREQKLSIEDAARRLRYDFLERARIQLGADFIAVGHTRDDQAETWLMRLLRGAGPRGLAAIRRSRGAVVRPLLGIGRAELHEWLARQGHGYRTDASNDDTSIARNRIRHTVLPVLERTAPGAAEALARAAAIAAEDDDFLSGRAAGEAARLVSTDEGGSVRVHLAGLCELHPAIARRVAREAMQRAAPARFVELKHVDAVLALAAAGTGQLDGPGQRVSIDGEWMRLTPSEGRSRAGAGREEESNVFCYSLSIPGETEIRESGVAISAQVVSGPGPSVPAITDGAVVAAAPLLQGGGLAVRNRRPGDRFRPLGLEGRKKLQDYFVDRKVPRRERDRVPLVVDADDRIVWVVGHGVAQEFRVTDPEGAVLLLKVRYLGGRTV